MKFAKRSRWGVPVFLLLFLYSAGWAQDPIPMPLPDFQITQLDGTTTSTKQLPLQDKWLLIYTQANCPSCDNLLRLVDKTESPDLPIHIVIIVSEASPDTLKDLQSEFPDLEDAFWYADPSENGVEQLKLPGMPVVFGVRGDSLDWCILGLLSGDSATMKSILTSWITN